ncbi:O-acetyl-ADP-ribose deacetylase [Kangiella japonica]|uniref:O-acetyl-ADP-ribose deacetylase n=1 Tax=Kangiella japonica TaxID=647384 RepID=A0ABN0T4Z6_9GAMM
MKLDSGDITQLTVDAIVNAANRSLLGGGGVDGAIHRAAGPLLLKECQSLGGCETGQAKITKGYDLPAKYVIHTVGPIWKGGEAREKELLASCYSESLKLADSHDINAIAFPCISTGIFGFPKQLAAEIAISTCKSYHEDTGSEIEIIFCCFGAEDTDIYKKLLSSSL